MTSPIEIFEKIYEHISEIDNSSEAYYHIAAATYDTWLISENSLEQNLARRLKNIMINILLDEIRYKYSETKHMENRPEYDTYFMKSINAYRNNNSNNLLIKHALDSIDLNNNS